MGTAPWLQELGAPLTPVRKHQLKRIKTFLKLQTVRVYTSSSGVRRCVGPHICFETDIDGTLSHRSSRFPTAEIINLSSMSVK